MLEDVQKRNSLKILHRIEIKKYMDGESIPPIAIMGRVLFFFFVIIVITYGVIWLVTYLWGYAAKTGFGKVNANHTFNEKKAEYMTMEQFEKERKEFESWKRRRGRAKKKDG